MRKKLYSIIFIFYVLILTGVIDIKSVFENPGSQTRPDLPYNPKYVNHKYRKMSKNPGLITLYGF